MNAMTNALHEAGLKPPSLKKCIWLWLKNHPNKTSSDIIHALSNRNPAAVRSQLWELNERKMVATKTRFDVRLWREVIEYSAVGSEYGLKPRQMAVRVHLPPQRAPENVVVIPAPLLGASKLSIESLTIAEARELYVELKRLFS